MWELENGMLGRLPCQLSQTIVASWDASRCINLPCCLIASLLAVI